MQSRYSLYFNKYTSSAPIVPVLSYCFCPLPLPLLCFLHACRSHVTSHHEVIRGQVESFRSAPRISPRSAPLRLGFICSSRGSSLLDSIAALAGCVLAGSTFRPHITNNFVNITNNFVRITNNFVSTMNKFVGTVLPGDFRVNDEVIGLTSLWQV